MHHKKDNTLIFEAYNKSINEINEATRRDFLKKSVGAIASTMVNTPVAALKAVAPKFSYDISDYVESIEDLRGCLDWRAGMLTTKGLLSHNTPDDIMDDALEDTFEKAQAGNLPANIWDAILRNKLDLTDTVVNTIEKLAWQKFDRYAGPYKNDPEAKALWVGNVIDTLYDEIFNELDSGEMDWDDIKHLVPPGDIIVNGKVVMAADDVIKNKILPSMPTAAKNLQKLVSGYTDWMKDFFVNPTGEESDYEKELKADKEYKDKEYAKSIQYSPADYKGGVDPETPKLALDSYKSINEMNEDRYELKPTRDGYVIIDHDIRGPNKIIARFDRDQRNDAIARYNHYTKQLSPDEIRAGFDNIRAGFTEDIKGNLEGVLGTIGDDGKPIVVRVPNLSTARHADYREIVSHGTGDGVKDFRYNPRNGIIYWWQPALVSSREREMAKDWIEAMPSRNYIVKGNKNVRDDFSAAHGIEESSDDSDKITPDTYELAKAIWPPDKFPSREAWEVYVRKWWPKLGSMNRAMDKAKMKQEANRGFSANKDEWEELSAGEVKANKDVRADIYDMVTAAYKSLGGHPDFPSVDRVPGDNDISSIIDTDEPDDADATILSKGTEFGTKITTIATDNGERARKEVIARIVGLLNTPGNYVEASGKLLAILVNKGVPTVNNADDVKRILKGKKIEWHNDGSYSRDIGGTTYVKRMLGKPYV